jgi:hypothetical protein
MEQYTSFHCAPLRAPSRPFTPTASLTPRIMMPVTVYVVASDVPFGKSNQVVIEPQTLV